MGEGECVVCAERERERERGGGGEVGEARVAKGAGGRIASISERMWALWKLCWDRKREVGNRLEGWPPAQTRARARARLCSCRN